MAKPYMGSSIVEGLRRDQMHTRDIASALEKIKKLFEQEGIPFALLGAQAMRHYGYIRHTEDIDLLTTKEGLEKIHEKLIGKGIVTRFQEARKSFKETEYNVPIDVITTGEHAGSQESPVIYPDPETFVMQEGVRIPELSKLIEFKLASGQWGNRPHDFGDVFNLIKSNNLNETYTDKLHLSLRPKFLELLDMSRKEKHLE